MPSCNNSSMAKHLCVLHRNSYDEAFRAGGLGACMYVSVNICVCVCAYIQVQAVTAHMNMVASCTRFVYSCGNIDA